MDVCTKYRAKVFQSLRWIWSTDRSSGLSFMQITAGFGERPGKWMHNYQHSTNMKSVFWKMAGILAVAALFACTPEENNPTGTDEPGGGKDGTVHVTGISLDHPSVTIKEGETITLVATVTPDNAANKTVKWSSSSETVATVDGNGKVTGIKAGSATITATTEDGGKKATCALTVEANLAPSVTVGAEHISAISVVLKGKANLGTSAASDLKIGFQYSKSAGIMPSNSTTVDAQDADSDYNYTTALTGLEPDTKYYFRSFVRQNGQDTYGETKEFTTKEISSVLVTLDATGVEATSAILNAKLDLTDVKYESIKHGFCWGTSEGSQNTFINGEAKDNAMMASMTGLNHKTQYWYKAYVKLDNQTFYGEVKSFTTDVVKVESVSLDKTEYTFNTIGNALTLKATVLPADATDKSVEWSSDNESVATVDNNGRVTAKGNGKAVITVKTKDQEKTVTCEVTVSQVVTSISLNKTSLTLNEGEEETLVPTINPSNAADKTIKWTSSDTSVATVDDSGKVTAVSKGTATIKAEANDGSGKHATCSITVKRLVSAITLDKTSIVRYRGTSNVTETITATVAPSDANNTNISWSSSNTSVASVSSAGTVTGKASGTATITVEAQDGSGVKASCEIEVRQYVTCITLDKTSLSLVVGQKATIAVVSVLPDNAYNKTISWWTSSDDAVVSVDSSGKLTAKTKGKVTIKAIANDGSGVFATCSVASCLPQAVDLGLSIKWADCNVGAFSPEDYGDYYAWGEVEPYYSSQDPLTWKDGKTGYNWASYKWCNGSSSTFTKYNTDSSRGSIDNKTVLDPEDDAAHVSLGGKWRMPTDAEWTELREKCTCTLTTQNGVNGQLVTGPNGNSIFLPAAGYRYSTHLANAGSLGGYWSSSLNTDRPYLAWYVYFNSDTVFGGNGYRYNGLSIRPVSE